MAKSYAVFQRSHIQPRFPIRIGSGAGDCAPTPFPTPPDVRFSASDGWHLGSASVVRSQRPRSRILAQVEGLLPWPVARQTGMRNRSVTFRCFIRMFVDSPELNLAPSIPSALRYSRLSPGINATTASADFPGPLSPGISLGQCQTCPLAPSGSTVIVDDSWASLVARLLAGDRPRLRFRHLLVRSFLRPLTESLRFQPGCSATVVIISPSGTFHPERFGTCQAHSGTRCRAFPNIQLTIAGGQRNERCGLKLGRNSLARDSLAHNRGVVKRQAKGPQG